LAFGAAHFFCRLAFLLPGYQCLGHLFAQLLPQLQNNIFDLGQIRLMGLFIPTPLAHQIDYPLLPGTRLSISLDLFSSATSLSLMAFCCNLHSPKLKCAPSGFFPRQ
jgi:hypothetical protein